MAFAKFPEQYYICVENKIPSVEVNDKANVHLDYYYYLVVVYRCYFNISRGRPDRRLMPAVLLLVIRRLPAVGWLLPAVRWLLPAVLLLLPWIVVCNLKVLSHTKNFFFSKRAPFLFHFLILSDGPKHDDDNR